ncbi:MAG: hypothetical protein ABR577_13545 [Pyrinomonadaceae bacterium]
MTSHQAGIYSALESPDFSISLLNVTSTTAKSLSSRPHTTPARLLAFALLLLITHGVTVEATHTHGTVRLSSRVADAAVFNNPNSEQPASKQSFSDKDCLICQLHQQLSGALFAASPGVAAPLSQRARSSATTVFRLSQTVASQRERGPPVISLS